MTRATRRKVHKDTTYVNLIMELAPGDRFRDCSFTACEFVGLGAEFEACIFIDCDLGVLGKAQASFARCQFGYTAGLEDDDDEGLVD